MGITVERASRPSPDVIAAIDRLTPQLTGKPASVNRGRLKRVLAEPSLALLLARVDEGEIVGMASVILVDTLYGRHARIEDVVVDAAARGRGAGTALTCAALQHAEDAGAEYVELTSAPRREAANRLYRRLGFDQRSTNVYRFAPR